LIFQYLGLSLEFMDELFERDTVRGPFVPMRDVRYLEGKVEVQEFLVSYILRPWLTAEAVTHHPRLGQRPPGGKPWVSLTSCWF
jgi:hypothetical protein